MSPLEAMYRAPCEFDKKNSPKCREDVLIDMWTPKGKLDSSITAPCLGRPFCFCEIHFFCDEECRNLRKYVRPPERLYLSEVTARSVLFAPVLCRTYTFEKDASDQSLNSSESSLDMLKLRIVYTRLRTANHFIK